MLLSDIQKGQRVRITKVKKGDLRTKLMEMGCVPGTSLSLYFKAPLGDPLAFDLNGYYLSMRKTEAENIEVEFDIDGK